MVILEVLCNVAQALESEDRRQVLLEEARHLREQALIALDGPDKREVEARFDELLPGYRQENLIPD